MKRSSIAVTGLLFSALLLGGCASKVTEPEQYSGFLADYSRLQPATSPTGQPVLRWMAPGVNLNSYKHVVVQSIGFHPAPSPSEQIGAPALAQLQAYTSEQVKAAFGRRFQVHEAGAQPGPNTLILRAAITGVDTKAEGLKPYEVIPIALVALVGALIPKGGDEDSAAPAVGAPAATEIGRRLARLADVPAALRRPRQAVRRRPQEGRPHRGHHHQQQARGRDAVGPPEGGLGGQGRRAVRAGHPRSRPGGRRRWSRCARGSMRSLSYSK